MDEEVSTSFWISFFVEAGIPPAAAANYAIIFTDNRIQKHMLLDLTKEYLKDMGLNILGDVIAILKHSKRYHEKVAREKVLAIDKELSVKKATKHLNEMLLKEEPPKAVAVPQQAVPQIKSISRPSPPKKLKTAKPEKIQLEEEEEIEWVEENEPEELKRKVIPPKSVTVAVKPTIASAKASKKTSVFDRLGESNVSSTTPEVLDSPTSAAKAAVKSQQSSVFRRLGGIQDTKETPTQPAKVTQQKVVLATAPLKKTIVNTKSAIPDSGKFLLRMDVENLAIKQSARERLGLDRPGTKLGVVSTKVAQKSSTARTTVSAKELQQTRLARPPQTTTAKQLLNKTNQSGVKQRLGSVATVKVSSTSSVFNRLGVTRKDK